MTAFTVFDETATVPVRARIGRLLGGADTADFAVARIRLAALDLQEREVAGVRRCRVLLGRFDAVTLHESLEGSSLRVLRAFIGSGRLEVRSAGLAGWIPDFSVIGGNPPVALFGAHHFGSPYPFVGPSFTVETSEPDAVALAGERFESLWGHGHDVLPAIRSVVQQAYEAVEIGTAGGGSQPDSA